MSIEHIVKQTIYDYLNVSVGNIANTDKLVDIHGFDSLALVEITMSLEDEFDTLLPDSDIENIETVQDVVDLCNSKVTQKNQTS